MIHVNIAVELAINIQVDRTSPLLYCLPLGFFPVPGFYYNSLSLTCPKRRWSPNIL